MSKFDSFKPTLQRCLFIAILSSFISIPSLLSQQIATEVTASAGETVKVNAELLLTWTAGESIVETYSDGTVLVVQGFHQPLIKITPQANYPANKDIVSVFPNPAVDFVTISMKGNLLAKGNTVRAELHDLLGKVVYKEEFMSDEHKIDLHLIANGAYILHLTATENNTLIGSFKIEKSN